jgi:hypothetical protein
MLHGKTITREIIERPARKLNESTRPRLVGLIELGTLLTENWASIRWH